MKTKSLLRYEARIIFGVSALLPALLLPLGGLLGWLLGAEVADGRRLYELTRAFELVAPLSSGLAVAHLMAVEREERFAELRASYPEAPWRLPLLRIGGAVVLAGVILGVSALLFSAAFGPFDPQTVALPAVAPAVLLIGLGLCVSTLSESYWAAAGAVMSYWFVELLTRGSLTRALFLFERTWPTGTVAYGVNRWLLTGMGVALLVIAALVTVRRRRPGGLMGRSA